MPEQLQSLPIISMCNWAPSMEGGVAVGLWGVGVRGEREEEGHKGREAQQFEIIAWMIYLLYFLNWAKAGVSWKENQEN